MSVFASKSFDDHEQVVFCNDEDTGLRAIIAVHSTTLGPAVGGCRMWHYDSSDDALEDVLRLSRGMSYKNALAGLNLGGGKSVIIGDSRTLKTPDLMRAFGRFVDRLGGTYITAEDMGMTTDDMDYIHESTDYVTGLTEGKAASGDPSPFTAHGVFAGIQAAVEHKLGSNDLKGVRVAIQGVGHVGQNLARELSEAGAEVIVTDVHEDNVRLVCESTGATSVPVDEIIMQNVDVFAPCAMGAILNDSSIDRLKASIIAGSANNQLAEERHDQCLFERGILYAPDFVINAGGMMSVANEIAGISVSPEQGHVNVEVIGAMLSEIFTSSDNNGHATGAVANALAEAKIKTAKNKDEASSQAA